MEGDKAAGMGEVGGIAGPIEGERGGRAGPMEGEYGGFAGSEGIGDCGGLIIGREGPMGDCGNGEVSGRAGPIGDFGGKDGPIEGEACKDSGEGAPN